MRARMHCVVRAAWMHVLARHVIRWGVQRGGTCQTRHAWADRIAGATVLDTCPTGFDVARSPAVRGSARVPQVWLGAANFAVRCAECAVRVGRMFLRSETLAVYLFAIIIMVYCDCSRSFKACLCNRLLVVYKSNVFEQVCV